MKGTRLIKKGLALAGAFCIGAACIPLAMVQNVEAAIDLDMGIEGYTSGTTWHVDATKSINMHVKNLEQEKEYTVKIEIAPGMRLSGYMWNSEWGKVPSGISGSASEMSDDYKGYLSGNSISKDDDGKTTLTYTISKETTSVNMSGQVIVKPDELKTYNQDNIKDAVKITLLQGENLIGAAQSYEVNVQENKFGLRRYPDVSVFKNDAVQVLMQSQLYASYDNQAYYKTLPTDKIDEVTMPLPANVTQVTDVLISSGNWSAANATFAYNKDTHVLVVKNLVKTGSADRVNLQVKGKISSDSTIGTHKASAGTTYKFTAYDGTVIDTADSRWGTPVVMQHVVKEAVENLGYTVVNPYDIAQPEQNCPTHFLLNSECFIASQDVGAQTITYDFGEDAFNICHVGFPIDPSKTENIVIKKIKFEDGVERNVNITVPRLNTSDTKREFSVDTLKSLDSTLPKNARFIQSITAECGSFGELKKCGAVFCGYWDEAVIAKNTNDVYNIKIKVYDGKKNTEYVQGCRYSKEERGSFQGRVNNINGSAAASTTVKAGETATIRVNIGTTYWENTYAKEGMVYVVLPEGISLDPSKVTAIWRTKDKAGKTTDTDVNERIRYSVCTVKAKDGKEHECYTFYVKDSIVSMYHEGSDNTARIEMVSFWLPFETDVAMNAVSYNLGDYIFYGKGEATKKLIPNHNYLTVDYIASSTHSWGIEGSSAKSQLKNDTSKTLNIIEDSNVTVSGYLAQSGETGRVAPYNPGADGSSDVNAVSFSTGTKADYHVFIKNTLKTDEKKAVVRAYVPIPAATISGSKVTSKNTGNVASKNLPSKYQFSDYKWPMTLSGKITNPSAQTFTIRYWLNECTLNSNGEPVANAKTVIKTEKEITNADFANVILVEIVSNNLPKDSVTDFVMPLSIGVDADQAITANLNGTKNIFRPWFYRESDGGSGYMNGNYVAAKLSVAKVGGMAFEDKDCNSIYEPSKGDAVLSNVTVKLFDIGGKTPVEKATTKTDSKGEYKFENLPNGKYKVQFTNPNKSTYHFAKTLNDATGNYMINSDAATVDTTHTLGEAEVTLPVSSGQQAGRQLYMNAGFVKKISVKIMNADTKKGKIANSTNELVSTQQIWPGEKISAPAVTPTGDNQFDKWMIGNNTFSFANAIDNACTITGYWKNVVTFDKGSNGTLSGTVKQYITKGGKVASVPTVTPAATHNFVAWKSNSGAYTTEALKNLVITEDVTFTATYSEKGKATIIFAYGGGVDEQGKTSTIIIGTSGATITGIPDKSKIKRTGYNVGDWNATIPKVFGAENSTTTYTLRWTLKNYTVKYDTDGGSAVPNKTGVYWTSDQLNPKEEPVKEGYTFEGWYIDSGKTKQYDNETYSEIAANDGIASITLYAKWSVNKYTISFDTQGGNSIESITADYGSDVKKPADPVRRGYKFIGWDKDIPTKMPAQDMVITAKWEVDKTVVTGVSLNVKDAVIEKGKTVTLKANITPDTAKNKTVKWTSSNTKVATVDKNGKVKGIKQGLVKITATTNDGGLKATANVRVLFDDVKKGHTFYNPIYWAADNGVTYGVTGTNNFAPANTVTRGQVIAFLYRMDGNPKTTGFINKFKDVTSKSTFYNPILWGGKSQVVAGYPDGTFRESVTCTRGQIVAFIWRMAGKPEPKTRKSPFPDINSAHTFYKAILWASENKITVGVSSGKYKGHFRAQDSCTRAQMVAFLQRFAREYPSKVKL